MAEDIKGTPGIDNQRRFWNDWNRRQRDRPEQYGDASRRGEVVLELLASLGLDRPRMLEIGCSTGWLCQELCRFGEVTGTDLADEAVQMARERVRGARFISGDFMSLDLDHHRFDVVITLETMAHIEDRQAFCARVSDILVEGGHLILTTQNAFTWERTSTLTEPSEIIQEFVTMSQLRELLDDHFRVLHTRTLIPGGDRGILRFVNSRVLTAPLYLLGRKRVRRLKERLNLGNTLIVLAQKR